MENRFLVSELTVSPDASISVPKGDLQRDVALPSGAAAANWSFEVPDGTYAATNEVRAAAIAADRSIDYPGKVYEKLTMQDLIKNGSVKSVEQRPELGKFMQDLYKRPIVPEKALVIPGIDLTTKQKPYVFTPAPGTGVDGNTRLDPGTDQTKLIGPSLPNSPDALIGGVLRYSDLIKTDKPSRLPTLEETAAAVRRGEAVYGHGFPAADQIVGIADFNQDGQKDLLLRNKTTGEMQFWYMNGTNKIGEAPLIGTSVVPGSNWEIEGVGDFNSDGRADIVWRELGGSNLTVVWYLNNNQYTGGATTQLNGASFTIPNGWRIDGVVDANNDGKADLLWREAGSSTTAFWYGTGQFNFVGGAVVVPSIPVSSAYSLVGVGDSNGDGVQDLFWQENASGNLIHWRMNAGYQTINTVGSGIMSAGVAGGVIEQVGDVNGDNKPDIVWKMPNGTHVAWQLGGNGLPTVGQTPYLPGNNTSATANFINNNFHSEFGYGMVDTTAAIALLKNQVQSPEQVDALAVNTSLNNNRQNEILNLPESWNQGFTGQGVTVAVVDSGVMVNHSDLNDNIWVNTGEVAGDGVDNDNNGYVDDVYGWDFIDNDNSPIPANNNAIENHGTQVAGMIAGEAAANGASITGGAFNARIMPLRVSVNNGYQLNAIAQATTYAANMGAKVINFSFGGNVPLANQTAVTNAVNYAVSKGAVVIISAGNGGADTIDTVFPAILAGTPGVIAVGATDAGVFGVASANSASRVASFSTGAGGTVRNYVMAPGLNIQTTTRDASGNATYGVTQGTSFAAPLVAAAIATIRQAVPGATPAQITNALAQTADLSDLYI